MLAAFAAVAARDPGLDLVIAGPDQVGLVETLRLRARQAGITARVHFSGMLGGDAKTGAYRAAAAFVLPSHQENFGIAVAEALACGTPVLISDQVAIWREVVADEAGLVAADTREGTIDLLARFIALPEDARAAMGRRARACFEARFHIEQAADSLMRVIEARIA